MDRKPQNIWEFFIFHRRFTTVVIIAITILGFASIISIPKESNPEVDIPIGFVSTAFPGASAEDVEELVTNIIEDKVLGVDGIEKVTSTSSEGVSVIVVEFSASADSEQKILDLKDAVDKVKMDLPDEANDPIAQKVNFSDMPIFRIALSGPFSVPQLKKYAEELADDIERVPGVSQVNIVGGQEKEIKVLVDKSRLDRFGFSIQQITGAIAQANADIPTGSIETAGANYTLRLSGRLYNIE
ncbi:efflux RND transporter permease subunit, partial [Patescibacteria group bacterium]